MSKKTIPFKMPAKVKPSPEGGEADVLPAARAASKTQITLPARRESERVLAAEPDQWVQHRDIDIEAEARPIRVATHPVAPAAARRLTLDISAERDLHEAVALAILIPPMLGWFWVANIVKRYWSHFG